MDKDNPETGKVLYQSPDYKPEKRGQLNARVPQSTKDQIKALVASGRYDSEGDVLIAAVHALTMDQPTIEQRAQVVRDTLNEQATDLYWTYQDAETMPKPEFDLYTLLMRVDGELNQFIAAKPEVDNETTPAS